MPRQYQIVFSKRARRDIKKMDPDVQKQVIEAAEALCRDPRPQSSKRIKGEFKGYRRERTGNYRIIYEIRDQKLVILVIRVGHRRDIYE